MSCNGCSPGLRRVLASCRDSATKRNEYMNYRYPWRYYKKSEVRWKICAQLFIIISFVSCFGRGRKGEEKEKRDFWRLQYRLIFQRATRARVCQISQCAHAKCSETYFICGGTKRVWGENRIHLWTDHIVIQFSTPLSRLHSVRDLYPGIWSMIIRVIASTGKYEKNLGKRNRWETIGW